MILLENVVKEYPNGIRALDGVDISIEKGEFVFIVGNSGSGKSTIIKLLLKEIKQTSGKIVVKNMNLSKIRRSRIPKLRREIGVVFQDFRLLRTLNVYDNIAFALKVTETPMKKIRRQVPSVLSLVGLTDKYKAQIKELSGGEQQRVAIARALVNNPPLLIADEPTGNLDPKNSWEIMKLFEEINKRGTTVVIVTHNREIVDKMQKRVITLKKGRVVSDVERGGYSDEN